MSLPIICVLSLLITHWVWLVHPYVHGCGAVLWSMENVAVAARSEKNNVPSPAAVNCWSHVSKWWTLESTSFTSAGTLASPLLWRSCAHHHCCVSQWWQYPAKSEPCFPISSSDSLLLFYHLPLALWRWGGCLLFSALWLVVGLSIGWLPTSGRSFYD